MTTPNKTTPTKPPPHSPSPAAARAACAACKHQRRRCSAFCPLAPYFPADKQKEFHNVHRLFGVRNVVELLKQVPPHSRDDAARSVIYEANFRAANPAGGCCAVVSDLNRRINLCQAELQIVERNLAFQRSRLLQSFNANCDFDASGDFIDDQKPLFKNIQECSGGRVMDYRNQEIVQQFLNDKPSLTEED
ncbi:hypothetical protein C2S51_032934 [Perilla frutescens var. frutescens]|nr:hypothetical protein C2S51_032934 [Perilla frutescens var. frutescens]